ncbi:hypothetical protein AB0N28_03520 [Streptomyces sp. NPDC051130]|uniref:hypothetical protein n=1 Tax=Streptomyces sp. NPDC051130 TaxID=3157223 RepID=UPI00343FEA1D
MITDNTARLNDIVSVRQPGGYPSEKARVVRSWIHSGTGYNDAPYSAQWHTVEYLMGGAVQNVPAYCLT